MWTRLFLAWLLGLIPTYSRSKIFYLITTEGRDAMLQTPVHLIAERLHNSDSIYQSAEHLVLHMYVNRGTKQHREKASVSSREHNKTILLTLKPIPLQPTLVSRRCSSIHCHVRSRMSSQSSSLAARSKLPPTVISEHENNEGTDHLAWSLMERVHLRGYKSTRFRVAYRNRSHILKLSSKFMYDGELKVRPNNNAPEPVGMDGLGSLLQDNESLPSCQGMKWIGI